jgi:predicted metal-binding membrane protein
VTVQLESPSWAEGRHAAPRLPLQERVILVAALGAITALSWLYLVWMPMAPADVGVLAGRLLAVLPPRLAAGLLTFMMWAVMMVAMMLPSASPMVLTYGRIVRGRSDTPAYALWIFAGAYFVIWTAFSAAATGGQLVLEQASLLRGAAQATPLIGALLLLLAGIYQLTPLKSVCLVRCRSPLGFFMTEWRSGASGALTMGIKHGVYCVGCCWTLMGLLFVFGVMNLLWVAALSGLVLLEKLAPSGGLIARASGILMLAGAIALAAHR